MKEIKIIDLLNMIEDGEELPEKIKYNFDIFYLNKLDERYYYTEKAGFGGECLYNCIESLHDALEIIEDNNKIEKLKIEQDGQTSNNFYLTNENGTKCYLTKHSKMIAEKINEIIDKINNL